MHADSHYQSLLQSIDAKQQLLGILIDPDKFEIAKAKDHPEIVLHVLVGQGRDARRQRNGMALEVERVARAVEPFVVRVGNGRGHIQERCARGGLDDRADGLGADLV